MKTIFESKEQYFTMKSQWAKSSKSPKCKSTLEPCDEWISSTNIFSEGTGVKRVKGWMRAEHYILYNILRNKPTSNGFSEPSKKKPDAFNNALNWLGTLQNNAVAIKPDKKREWLKTHLEAHIHKLLEPFGNTVTMEQFINLDIPKFVIIQKPMPMLETT